MERYYVLSGSRTIPVVRRGQSREQAMLHVLSMARDKPAFLNNMAALMKVTKTVDWR